MKNYIPAMFATYDVTQDFFFFFLSPSQRGKCDTQLLYSESLTLECLKFRLSLHK